MTLPAGAARASADIDRYLVPAPGLQQSRYCALAPAADIDREEVAIDETDGRKDGRTDIRPLHRSFTAYYAGSENKQQPKCIFKGQ